MIIQDYVIILLWLLGGHSYVVASRGIAALTGNGHLTEGVIGAIALSMLYVAWPIIVFADIIKRR